MSIQVYYDFIKSIELNNLENIAKKYETYENDKPLVAYCLNVIQLKDVKFNDNLLKDLKQEKFYYYSKSESSYRKYKHTVYLNQYGNYNKTSTYFLWNLVKIMDNIDDIKTFMEEDQRLTKYAKGVKDQIKRLINMTFYNILYQNYKKLYEHCEYSLKNSLNDMKLEKFIKLYNQDQFFPYCLDDICLVLKRYDFVKAYIDQYYIGYKILFFENEKDLNQVFEKYSHDLIMLDNKTEASGEYSISIGKNTKKYSLVAGSVHDL
jgi:hypothetical protein